MSGRFGLIKTTVVGGFFFLVPAVIIIVVLGKVMGVLKTVAKVLAPIFGVKSALGGIMLDVIAKFIMIVVCFAGGLLAKAATASRARERLDAFLLDSFPGYAFVKGFADNLRTSEELAGSFLPVLVRFDDYDQVAFETKRHPGGKVAIYLPGAPNPWSGSIVFVASDRVSSLQIPLKDALPSIRTLGKKTLGTEDAVDDGEVATMV